ncbi:MAG: flagellar hook-basal body complex protein [Alphaproteobacteria bacterium]|jgi:flagellar hook protein FlgE|uniref:flagellar hook protein FlgE n=1 Tax=Pseudorhizobium TaxID=1903858 RepID=UPI0004975375|nr:flagellar hook protein FlgE [Pseudorhizobium marinum]MBU1314030.1 flagellar hook-basal body complex protein [Alphaproteobacteria bacterium]MBU1552382.1 flagellar hook-basal body complex protein [Alphaproteobacteria bacterium]MBU2339587.1 flagellar hook-basal body complex protein [Alphaproteobacteria bacterium]MBU2390299.1 flagellar hook-basal body complex protein [Alphaproteobacteria bacterium]
MSLYGTMRTGVSGMNAQANRLSTVGDNIANASTAGYKKASTQFSSLILPSGEGSYNSGGVTTNVRYSISSQGTFTYTTSATDLAINGRGFFIVQGTDGVEYLTRAGNFTGMSDGSLQNAAGFTLMGYEYVEGQDPTIVINGFDGLTEVNLSSGALNATPSVGGILDVNLPSQEAVGYEKKTSLKAYDTQGNTRLLDITYTKLADNSWTVDVAYEGTSLLSREFDPLADATTDATAVGNLDSIAADGTTFQGSEIAYDLNGDARTLRYDYIKGPTGWSVNVYDGMTSTTPLNAAPFAIPGGALVIPATGTLGAMTIDFSAVTSDPGKTGVNSPSNGIGRIPTMEFDALGKIITPLSLTTQAMAFGGAEFNSLTISIDGSTQLSSEFKVGNGKIDGNAASNVVGHEISEDGIVYLKYSNGDLVPKYRIAVADVQSPDQLNPLAGNVYTQSNDSGIIVMGYAGNGSYGTIISNALEDSNVDIAEELTSMIESQRNYTANSKVFQTGSELMEVLVNLKR